MAKRTRDADVPPLMRAIASRDRSGGGGEVGGDEPLEAKEKLLQEGDADAAWQLHLEEEERKFWQTVQAEANEYQGPYISHDLPLARVKRLMKVASCFNPRMIGADAPSALAYLGECFTRLLARRAWSYAAVKDRRTLQYKDIFDAMDGFEQCDFLVEVVREFNENRMQHRQTKDAQRVRALMSGCDGDHNEEDTDDDECPAAADSSLVPSPALAASAYAATSASSPWWSNSAAVWRYD